MKYKNMIISLAVFQLLGCDGEDTGLPRQVDIGLEEVAETALYQIIISPSTTSTYLPQNYKATGKFDDGTEKDITSSVTWVVTEPSTATLNSSGEATLLMVGSTQITASLNGISSNVANLNVVDTLICGHLLGFPLSKAIGGGINDASDSAEGGCIKLLYDTNNDLTFTSSPSENFMKKLGVFVVDVGNGSNDLSYRGTAFETGGVGGLTGNFAVFDQLGAVGDGFGGQFDRYCKYLGEISYAGREDWRRPEISELTQLYTFLSNKGEDVDSTYLWPVLEYYWSSTPGGSTSVYRDLYLESNSLSQATAPRGDYASCVVSGTVETV